jgi:hypothetical protein
MVACRGGHGSDRAGFGSFSYPTRACRVWTFSTRDNTEILKNRRVSGGLAWVILVGLLGSGSGIFQVLKKKKKKQKKERKDLLENDQRFINLMAFSFS